MWQVGEEIGLLPGSSRFDLILAKIGWTICGIDVCCAFQGSWLRQNFILNFPNFSRK